MRRTLAMPRHHSSGLIHDPTGLFSIKTTIGMDCEKIVITLAFQDLFRIFIPIS